MKRRTEMLVVLGVVVGQEPIVDALRVEQPLLGADQRVDLGRVRAVAQCKIGVDFVAQRLRQGIERGGRFGRCLRGLPTMLAQL